MFLPPTFPLYEFDDSALLLRHSPGRRVFRDWNGLVTEPAEQVLLEWMGSEGEHVVISTALRHTAERVRSARRIDAIVLAGNNPPEGRSGPQLSAAEAIALLNALEDPDPGWIAAQIEIDGIAVQVEARQTTDGSFGGGAFRGSIVAFASHAVPLAEIRLRAVTTDRSDAYPLSPLTPHTSDEFASLAEHHH